MMIAFRLWEPEPQILRMVLAGGMDFPEDSFMNTPVESTGMYQASEVFNSKPSCERNTWIANAHLLNRSESPAALSFVVPWSMMD